MRRLALLAAALLALPALATEDLLPPPPPPPADDIPLPPPPPGTERRPIGVERRPASIHADAPLRARPAPLPGRAEEPVRASGLEPRSLWTGPITAAGSQVAPLAPGERRWSIALASGVMGRFGGMQISERRENSSALIYLGGQADGAWTEGFGRGARLRLKLMTGGEGDIFIPSDGELEAAFLVGRPEFRFVVGRLEVARYPNLGLEALAQLSTLPSVEGTLPLGGEAMRLSYFVSPVEMAYAFYYGDAHIEADDPAPQETDSPAAATAARLRYSILLPPSILFSLQGDLLKFWKKADTLVGAEGSLGYQVLDQTVAFNVAVRWTSYTRRAPSSKGATDTSSDLRLMAMATLVF